MRKKSLRKRKSVIEGQKNPHPSLRRKQEDRKREQCSRLKRILVYEQDQREDINFKSGVLFLKLLENQSSLLF